MSITHAGKTTVVTGAARGMGQAVALRMAKRGARVVGLDRLDLDETGRMVADAGGEWLGITADLTSEQDIAAAAEAVNGRYDHADILINVAGVLPRAPFEQTDYEMFKRVQTINLDSMFLTCKAFTPGMQAAKWGRVINFSSGIFFMGVPGYTAYMTSKASVMGFTHALAVDLGDDGVTVNCVTPSFVITPGTIESGDDKGEPFIRQMQIIKRQAMPEDVTGLVSFLASDDADFITGQMMHADGGLVMR